MNVKKNLILEDIHSATIDDFYGYSIWNNRYEDHVWYSDDVEPVSSIEEREQLKLKSKSIGWFEYQANCDPDSKKGFIYDEIINDIKKAALIYSKYPALVGKCKTKKPSFGTVKGRVSPLLTFFSLVTFEMGEKGEELLSLSDVTFEVLKEYIPMYTGRSAHLKRALKLLYAPPIVKNYKVDVPVTIKDIDSKTIYWSSDTEYQGIPTLSNLQFVTLLNYCEESLIKFAYALEIIESDEYISNSGFQQNAILNKHPDFYQEIEWACMIGQHPKQQAWYKKRSYTSGHISNVLKDTHLSAICIIFMLTGYRYSDSTTLKKGALFSKSGFTYIKAKRMKGNFDEAPEEDTWLVIQLSEIAIKVLDHITDRTNNSYLISAYLGRRTGKPFTNAGLSRVLNRWIKRTPELQSVFKNDLISPHVFRESLAAQLADVGVGLPYISHQLKHYHTQFKIAGNQVTAGYGEYHKNLMKGIDVHTQEAREKLLLDIYGEDSNFAGGAAETHKVKVDAFFKGMGLFGEERKEYIKALALKKVTIKPTSIGGCTLTPQDSKEGKPCYGDYQCDPDCEQHLISSSCQLALVERRKMALKNESSTELKEMKTYWKGLSEQLNKHIIKLVKV